jgi:catechol 2,3-dioxygenase-like lactoylglutathione lyase family enzyme
MQKHTSIVELDHVSVPVRDLKRARRFYERALGAIGMKVNLEVSSAFGMGSKKQKIFWLARDPEAAGNGHYALRVDQRHDVDSFYEAALAAGGVDNGPPGPRPDYGPSYYAAFVKDREGNNVEIVCYAPGGSGAKRSASNGKRRAPPGAKRSASNGKRRAAPGARAKRASK